MKDLGLLILRLTVGLFMAGHGSQKLFGWFKGPGLQGTHGFMEQLGMRPGKIWGTMAAVGEFSGGTLTALGFLNPLGPLNIAAAMTVASRRVHWKLPLWAGQGGAELPMTNIAAALAIAMAGPGRYSLDRLFGIRVPRPIAFLATVATIAVTYAAVEQPEVAETLMNRATEIVNGPTPAQSTDEPDLVVETVPRRQEAREPQTQPTA